MIMDLQLREGWIEVIAGSMYAGKTEELLRRIRRIEYAKKKVIVFKPEIDNRYSNNEVVSHNKTHMKSINIKSSSDVLNYVKEPYPYAVAFDEIQFMDEGIIMEQGSPKDIFENPQNDRTKAFLSKVL